MHILYSIVVLVGSNHDISYSSFLAICLLEEQTKCCHPVSRSTFVQNGMGGTIQKSPLDISSKKKMLLKDDMKPVQ